MQMHDGHDNNRFRLFAEEDAERKCLCQAAAHVRFDHGEDSGVDADAVDGILHRRKKSPAEVCLLRLIVRCRRNHFGFSGRIESGDLHGSDA